MTSSGLARAGLIIVLVAGGLGACSEGQELVDDTAELAARTIAAEGGEEGFANAGIEVDGDLECTSTSEGGADRVSVTCTGSGVDGEELAVEASVVMQGGDSGDEARGTFVGTADGEEVFSEECIGTDC